MAIPVEIQKILDHIKKQRVFTPIGKKEETRKAWTATVENAILYGKKSNFYSELIVLNVFLKKYNLKLLDSNGKEFNFSPINFHAKISKNKVWFDEWCGENGKHTKQFRHFFEDLAETKVKYPQATFSFLNNHGYSVVYEGKNITNVDIQKKSEKSPSCEDLRTLAKEIRKNTGEVQPQPENIFVIWEKKNNKVLEHTIREQLIQECFRKK